MARVVPMHDAFGLCERRLQIAPDEAVAAESVAKEDRRRSLALGCPKKLGALTGFGEGALAVQRAPSRGGRFFGPRAV